MRIKHSKYKNTGLIYELLVKQIAADTLSKKDSPAVSILKKFFAGKSSLTKDVTILLNESGLESAKTKKARDAGISIVTNLNNLIGVK